MTALDDVRLSPKELRVLVRIAEPYLRSLNAWNKEKDNSICGKRNKTDWQCVRKLGHKGFYLALLEASSEIPSYCDEPLWYDYAGG